MHRIVVAVVASWLLLAPAAQAAEPVTSREGYTLLVDASDPDTTCFSVRTPNPDDESESCTNTLPTDAFSPIDVLARAEGPIVGLVVAPDVAAASGADPRERIPTEGGAGIDARFVLVPYDGRETVVRFYDAAGDLSGAWVADPREAADSPGPVVYDGGGRRLRASTAVELFPTPLQLDRTRRLTCLQQDVGDDGGFGPGCQPVETLGPFGVTVQEGCAPRRALLQGLVGPMVARVEARLGSGRRLRVAARPLPGRIEGRLVAAPVPRGEAVRDVRYLAAGGRALGREALRVPPTGGSCDDDLGSSQAVIAYGTDARPVAEPVALSPQLRVADGADDTLCTGATGRLTCAVPPVIVPGALLHRQGTQRIGVVPRSVTQLRVELDDRTRSVVATDPGAAYTGRYAGLVRFAAVTVPAGRVLRSVTALDDAGRALGAVDVEPDTRTRVRRRPLGDGLDVVRITERYDGRTSRSVCVTVHGGGFGTAPLTCRGGPRSLGVSVPCATRRAVVFGRLPAGATPPVALLRGGGTRTVAVRRIAGFGQLFVLSTPRDVAIRALRTGGRRVALRVPPPARQCGYRSDELLGP